MATKMPKYTVTLEIKTDAPEKDIRQKSRWDVLLFGSDGGEDYGFTIARILSVEPTK